MKASELRIGNYVEMGLNSSPNIKEIHVVEPTTLMMLTGEVDNKSVFINPIPLTDEWLINKANFITGGYLSFHTGNAEFIFNDNHISLATEGQWLSLNHITSVHQFQNLYFSIMDEELKISE